MNRNDAVVLARTAVSALNYSGKQLNRVIWISAGGLGVAIAATAARRRLTAKCAVTNVSRHFLEANGLPTQRSMNSCKGRSKSTTTRRNSSQLSDEQRWVRSEVMSGKSCFLTGCGGTGKTFLTAKLIADLQMKYGLAAVAVTATTGIAACHIGGVSLHSFAGIGLGQGSARELISKVRENKSAMDSWKATQCLIIDEISMLDCALFEKIDQIARTVRQNRKPFGGIQLLLAGDFAQLPPVSRSQSVKFCFESHAWGEAIQLQVELKKVFRQSDTEFVNMLSSIRLGICTPEIIKRLNSTRNNPLLESNGVQATRIFSKNVDVEALNMKKVSELPGDLITLLSHDQGHAPYLEALKKSCLAPHQLLLKQGAQVMLLKNLDFDLGLTNGTRGVFLKALGPGAGLLVRFETPHGVKEHVVHKEIFSMEVLGREVASRVQYPLKAAYAITIHKCQGMTLTKAELSLSGVFEYGQAYVALSRVSSLAGMRVLGLTPSLVRCHPRVLKFYAAIASDDIEPCFLPPADAALASDSMSSSLPPPPLADAAIASDNTPFNLLPLQPPPQAVASADGGLVAPPVALSKMVPLAALQRLLEQRGGGSAAVGEKY